MPSSHLILCRPLLLLPPIPPSIRVFSNESPLHMRWPKYWSFSFSISLSNEHPGLISFKMDWLISLQSTGLSRVFSNTTVQKHQFFGTQLSSQSKKTTEINFLMALEVGTSRSSCWQGWFLLKPWRKDLFQASLLLVDGHLLLVTSRHLPSECACLKFLLL